MQSRLHIVVRVNAPEPPVNPFETHPDHPDHPASLTLRETEVLGCLSRGMTDKEIARDLGISPFTVSNHLRNMGRKAGVGRRAALVSILGRINIREAALVAV